LSRLKRRVARGSQKGIQRRNRVLEATMQDPCGSSQRQTPMRAQRHQASPASAGTPPNFHLPRTSPATWTTPVCCQGSVCMLVPSPGGVGFAGSAGCGHDREGPLGVRGQALMRSRGPAGRGQGPGTAGGSSAGQHGCGSHIAGQAVPGVWGVSRLGAGGGRPRGRRNASGSG
jgi:hypothetical protein